jgi:hypothetical protein
MAFYCFTGPPAYGSTAVLQHHDSYIGHQNRKPFCRQFRHLRTSVMLESDAQSKHNLRLYARLIKPTGGRIYCSSLPSLTRPAARRSTGKRSADTMWSRRTWLVRQIKTLNHSHARPGINRVTNAPSAPPRHNNVTVVAYQTIRRTDDALDKPFVR